MKRREFLSMALGAAVFVPLAKSIVEPEEASDGIKAQICAGMQEIAVCYASGAARERTRIVNELNELIAKMRSEEAVRFLREFRNGLLSCNVIPAGGVR